MMDHKKNARGYVNFKLKLQKKLKIIILDIFYYKKSDFRYIKVIIL